MTSEAERFREAKRLFAEAALRPPEDRDRWLEGACGGDPSLLAEVRGLLAADTETEDAVPLPDRIGGFAIVRRIGAGGMGTVYEAEQESPRRRVALKVMTPVFADEEGARRFRYETEVLGQLDHPGIARIYSAGVHEGRPWFAMELVEGVELTEYVRSKSLSRRDRLVLLQRICEAVHEAHLRGIVHRDLKPANILVDKSSHPKLLDFGLAKVVDGERWMTTLATRAGQLLGTIPYMAPEQVSMEPGAIDLRTDVYALGVIAFELLSGRHPLDLSGHSLAEALLRVRDSDAPRLGSVHTQWKGDIETIVAKALEKEKSRRYASAGELGADIGRYLRDQPIVARPASRSYQLRKFVRRHRVLVSGLAATFLALVAGVVVSTTYFFKARDERDEARRQETRANEQSARANEQSERANAQAEHAREQRQLADRREVVASRALDFMVEVFKSEDPLAAPGDVPTTREVLDRATRGVEEQIGDEPELQGVLADAIGTIYVNIGDNARARSLYEHALDAFRRIEKDDPKRLPAKGLLLALDHLAQGLEVDGEFERAATLRRELLERARRGEGGDDALAGALLGFATHYSAQKQLDKAEEFYRAVLAGKDGRFASSTRALVKAREGLADVLTTRGRTDEAIHLLREAAAEAEQTPEYQRELTLGIQVALAGALRDARRIDEALAVYKHLADTYLPRLDPDQGQALRIRLYYGGTLLMAGRTEEAIDMIGDCLARVRRTFGETHRNYLVFLQKYVEACTRAGRLKGLEPQARELVELHKRTSGGDYELGGHLITLANVIAVQGEPRRAIPYYLEALDAVRRSVGIETVPGAHTLVSALRAYIAAEAYEEAMPLARESLAVQAKVLGKQSVNYMLAAHHLGIVLLRTGDPGAAEPLLRESRELLKTHGPASPEMAATLEGLAESLAAQGRTDEAIEAAREYVAFAQKNYKEEDPRLAAARKRLEDLAPKR